MKILIMGLSGSGKSTLADQIKSQIPIKCVNADIVREQYDDWDFSDEGRIRQAQRMADLLGDNGIADFICPTPETRRLFNADYIIWMDTVQECKYEDTNKMFISPQKYDLHITNWDYNVEDIVDVIVDYQVKI